MQLPGRYLLEVVNTAGVFVHITLSTQCTVLVTCLFSRGYKICCPVGLSSGTRSACSNSASSSSSRYDRLLPFDGIVIQPEPNHWSPMVSALKSGTWASFFSNCRGYVNFKGVLGDTFLDLERSYGLRCQWSIWVQLISAVLPLID